MKTTTINLRVSSDLRNQLEELAVENNISTSELTRSIISDYFSNSNSVSKNKIGNTDVILSYEFTQLVFWIVDKLRDQNMNEHEGFYHQLINTIGKLNSHPLFNDEVLCELNKISNELKAYFRDPAGSEYWLNFPEKGNEYSFNYDIFSEFFHSLVYDDSKNRITVFDSGNYED